MNPLVKMTLGSILIFIAMLGFLMEFKAFPHNPKNPEWWDAFHEKHIRNIICPHSIIRIIP